MFELIDLILAFVLGSICATMAISWIAHRWLNHLRELLEEAMNEVADPKDDNDLKSKVESGKIVLLEVEVENNQFFCYNSKTNQFVCQGKDVGEIIENFKQRFPGLNAVLHTGDETALKTLRQQLKEHRETSDSIGSSS